MKSGGLVVVGLVALTAAAFAFALTQSTTVTETGVRVGVKTADATCADVGEHPCMPRLTYVDVEGNSWTPEMLEGKVVVVNFWATWCRPCLDEIPLLRTVYADRAAEGLVILGLVSDREISDGELSGFAGAFGVNYPVVRVTTDLSIAFDSPSGLPTTFIYDRTGHLAFKHLGPLTQAQLDAVLPALMAATP